VIAFVCESCGTVVCPARALCPRCGASSWREVPAGSGLVEETTRVGGAAIASVRLDSGPVVVARVSEDAAPGDRVDLTTA
jgi:uncharacterized OB-fold protein